MQGQYYLTNFGLKMFRGSQMQLTQLITLVNTLFLVAIIIALMLCIVRYGSLDIHVLIHAIIGRAPATHLLEGPPDFHTRLLVEGPPDSIVRQVAN